LVALDVGGGERQRGDGIDVGASEYQAEAEAPARFVTVRAHGTAAGGVAPAFDLYVNGQLLATTSVDSTEPADYPIALPSGTTIERLDLVFVNDQLTADEDRNLFIDGIDVAGEVVAPEDPRVSFDRGADTGAFDGIDVLPGTGRLWWNGALRIVFVEVDDEPAAPPVVEVYDPGIEYR
jgi:hypothetical protein